jgi:plasmid stabilization system protein ParE
MSLFAEVSDGRGEVRMRQPPIQSLTISPKVTVLRITHGARDLPRVMKTNP